MKHVLVTGGGGFVGQPLVRALIRRGCEVTVLGRNDYPALADSSARCLRGDVRDPATLDLALAGQDTVFHVAALAGIWGTKQEYFNINLQGTRNVLAGCRQHGVRRCIYTSSSSVVFNNHNMAGGDESLPYAGRPLCHYVASKAQAEREVLAAHSPELQTISIRPHLIWGPHDRHIIPKLLARGRAGLTMVGTGENRVDISYIDNVVDAHLLAAENLLQQGDGGGQSFFIGQEEPVLLWPWINALFARLGIPQVQKKIPFSLAYVLGMGMEALYNLQNRREDPPMTRFLACQLARSHWFSHQKAEKILAYSPKVSTEEGLERLIASLLHNESTSKDKTGI